MLESPSLIDRQLIERFIEALRELPEIEADLDQWEPVGKHDARGYDAKISHPPLPPRC